MIASALNLAAYTKNRTIHELMRLRAAVRHRGSRALSPDLPLREVRRILVRNGLGFDARGVPSWWYASLDCRRNEADDLTRAAMTWVDENVRRDARILGTGCGTGWMLFWFAQRGFENVEGFDYLENVVRAATEIAALARLDVRVWQADGFDPRLTKRYDVVLVLHWLYSAWMGNYGNTPASQDRETCLRSFLRTYTGHLEKDGLVLLELIDANADYLDPPSPLYPIRHDPEQVARCAGELGFAVERKVFNFRYGHLPRMLYFLRRKG